MDLRLICCRNTEIGVLPGVGEAVIYGCERDRVSAGKVALVDAIEAGDSKVSIDHGKENRDAGRNRILTFSRGHSSKVRCQKPDRPRLSLRAIDANRRIRCGYTLKLR